MNEFIYTSQASEKPRKYLHTPFRLRRSICTHFFGAGEVLVYTYMAPEKHLYTPRRVTERTESNKQARLERSRLW